MDYNSLFNFLYSTEISEATKIDVVSKLNQPIQESKKHIVFKQDLEDASIRKLKRDNPNVMYVEDEYLDLDGSQAAKKKRMEDKVNKNEALMETYMELLDTLVFSTASESLIYDIIDETFANVDEAFINEVSDEWIKRKTQAGLKAREQAYKKANDSVKSGVIGLSQLNKQAATKAKLEKGKAQVAARTPRASQPSAMSKLKSAVGKVKNWMGSDDRPIGLSRIVGAEANRQGVGAETLRQQTTHKASNATKSSTTGSANTGAATTTSSTVTNPQSRKEKIEELRNKFGRKDSSKTLHKENNENPLADSTLKSMRRHEDKAKKDEAQKKKEEKNSVSASLEKAFQFKDKPEVEKTEVKSEVKANDATEAAEATKPKAEKVEQPKAKTEKPKVEKEVKAEAKQGKATKPKAEKVEQPKAKVEKPKAEKTEVKSEVKANDATEAAKEAPKAKETKEAKATKANKAGGKKEIQSEVTVSPQDKADVARYAEERHKSGNIGKRALEVKQAREERKAKEAAKKAEEEKAKQAAEATKKTEEKEQSKPAKAKVEKPQTEAPKVELKNDKPKEEEKPQKSNLERMMAASRKQEERMRKDQEKLLQSMKDRRIAMTSKPGYDEKELKDLDSRIVALEKKLGKQKVTEAIADVAYLLAHTNISEACFVEIMETLAVHNSNAAEARSKREQFEKIFNDKFNDNE